MTLQAEGKEVLEVRGEYRGELENLDGAQVRAKGKVEDGRLLVVTSYEILEIAGRVPSVGVLRRSGESYSLDTSDGKSLPIGAVPEAFAELEGAKIWVLIDDRGGVGGYGIIRKR